MTVLFIEFLENRMLPFQMESECDTDNIICYLETSSVSESLSPEPF